MKLEPGKSDGSGCSQITANFIVSSCYLTWRGLVCGSAAGGACGVCEYQRLIVERVKVRRQISEGVAEHQGATDKVAGMETERNLVGQLLASATHPLTP